MGWMRYTLALGLACWLGYTVLRNDGRVLSFAVDGEGCGAYCETYTRYLQFDARNGRALAPQDLLTTGGGAKLQRQMRAERARRYRLELRGLKRNLARGQRPADAGADAPLGDLRMGLAANGRMLLTAERCSNHASRALDDVGEVTLKRSPAALAPHLTAYGSTLTGLWQAPGAGAPGRPVALRW